MRLVTLRHFIFFLALLVAAPIATALGQAGPELGNDFIFFRNGANASIPNVDGTEEADANNPSEISLRYNFAAWFYPSFNWERPVGVDMRKNLAANDILHVKLKVDPANAASGLEETFIMFEDATNDTSDDLPMRLVWQIPATYRDGNWHTLEIPLPPPTCSELANQRGTLGLANNWWYGGSWSAATDRVGGYNDDCGGGNQYWKEFTWTNVKSLGVFWDYNAGGGSIWVDDLYIGQSGLDLTVADAPPAPLATATYSEETWGNKISWTHDDTKGIGGYRIYASSLVEIDSDALQNGFIQRIGQVSATAADQSFSHYFSHLTPHLAIDGVAVPAVFEYAITTVSQFGVENFNVDGTHMEFFNLEVTTVEPANIISELTATETTVLFADLAAGNASGAGFGAEWPTFVVNQSRSKLGDQPTPPDNDADLSGEIWLGYNQDNELWIYAEVMDDDIEFPVNAIANPWEYDIIELGWANYSLVDLDPPFTADPFLGTTHQDFQRGERADYSFRVMGLGTGALATAWNIQNNEQSAGSGATVDFMEDGSGNQIGYKILAVIALDEIQVAAQSDVVVAPPGTGEGETRAINIVLGDRDGGQRAHQIQWSLKDNAGSQWWNTPAEWDVTVMLGRGIWDLDADSDVPTEISLEQNYPNPFNPQTNIQFSLSTAETVYLTVHDLLGRTVATVLNGNALSSGTHTVTFDGSGLASGMYMYRLQVGSSFVQTRSMVLVK